VERLCARNARAVRCFVRPRSNRSCLDQLQLEYPNCKLEYVVGNLTSAADCRRALDDITTVFHLAAQMKGLPASIFLNTVVASSRILEAVLESGPTRVVLVSSMAVYGSLNGGIHPILDESAPVEPCPQKRDVYSQAKLWQESLFRKLETEKGYELLVLRPGIIYGQGGEEFPPRIGLKIGNVLWRFGRDNLLPLTHVLNCAEAVVMAGLEPGTTGPYNIIDDNLPTASEYLDGYRQSVRNVPSIWIPWWLTQGISKAVEAYSNFSRGQLPPALTPYKSAVLWRGTRFDNSKLKALGWRPIVPTAKALQITFEYFRRHAETMTGISMSSEVQAASMGARPLSYDAEG